MTEETNMSAEKKLELLFKIDTTKDHVLGALHQTERRLAVVFTRIEGRVESAFARVAGLAEDLT